GTKKPAHGRFFMHLTCPDSGSGGFERLHSGIQPALVTSGLVLVNDTLVSHPVDDRHCLGVGSRRILIIAFGDGLDDVLHVGANHGTKTCVMAACNFVLTCALAGLCGVSQLK